MRGCSLCWYLCWRCGCCRDELSRIRNSVFFLCTNERSSHHELVVVVGAAAAGMETQWNCHRCLHKIGIYFLTKVKANFYFLLLFTFTCIVFYLTWPNRLRIGDAVASYFWMRRTDCDLHLAMAWNVCHRPEATPKLRHRCNWRRQNSECQTKLTPFSLNSSDSDDEFAEQRLLR